MSSPWSTTSSPLKRRLALAYCRLQARQVALESAAAALLIALVLLALGPTVSLYDQLTWAACLALTQAVRIQCARRLVPWRLASAQACFATTAAMTGLLVGAPISLFAHLIPLSHALTLSLAAIAWLAVTAGMHTALRASALFSGALILVQIGAAWVQTPFPAPELGLPALLVYAGLLASLISQTHAAVRQSIIQSHERRQLIRKLAHTTRSARQAHQSARKFFACASHDLRQPASALGLLSTLLHERCTDSALKPLVQGIERSSRALTDLLESLLNLSRLDAGVVEPHPQWTPIAPLLEQLRFEFEPQASKKGLSLVLNSCDGKLLCDPILLGRCIRNLLDNAIRYTPSGRIVLGARAHLGGIQVQVCDSGIGIAPELHGRIFDDHFQVAANSHEGSRGLGLGLAIVKRMAALMSATIRVQSDGQHGSCFTLSFLPCHSHLQSATILASAAASDREPPRADIHCPSRILLVEDDAEVAQSIGLLLQTRGDHVIHVFSVEGALHRLNAGDFDLLITDFRLPGQIDGLHLIEHVRQLHPEVKCLLATADTHPTTHERARSDRVPVVRKPLTVVNLDHALRCLLSDTTQH